SGRSGQSGRTGHSERSGQSGRSAHQPGRLAAGAVSAAGMSAVLAVILGDKRYNSGMDISLEGLTDDNLVEAARVGGDEAFAELVRRHKRKVLRLAYRYARDKGELDDIAQDIFIKIYRNLGGYRKEAPFEHWLTRVAISACYDFLRKKKKSSRDVSLEDVEYNLSVPAEEGKELEALQAKEILDKALAKLKPMERIVITLLELEERPVKEIAVITGLSEANVKVRAFRARKALKKMLGVDGEV
ncbi:MAG: RNA polymerase sigma factor, partial [Nitrospirota bacterium]